MKAFHQNICFELMSASCLKDILNFISTPHSARDSRISNNQEDTETNALTSQLLNCEVGWVGSLCQAPHTSLAIWWLLNAWWYYSNWPYKFWLISFRVSFLIPGPTREVGAGQTPEGTRWFFFFFSVASWSQHPLCFPQVSLQNESTADKHSGWRTLSPESE